MRARKTIVDDYLREVRPLFAPRADVSADASIGRGGLPVRSLAAARGGAGRSRPDAAGLCRDRVAWLLPRRRGRVGVLARRRRICCAASRAACGGSGGLPRRLVWDRQGGLHAGRDARRTRSRRCCGAARRRRGVLPRRATRRPRARSSGCRASWRRSFEPGRRVRQRARLPGAARRLVRRARQRAAAQDAACSGRSTGSSRSGGDGAAAVADAGYRPALGACASPPDPYLRFDTCDYSLDPRLVGRRVEAASARREVLAVALDTGELACRSPPLVRQAPHDHRARARPHARGACAQSARRAARADDEVERRRWPAYDALIPA